MVLNAGTNRPNSGSRTHFDLNSNGLSDWGHRILAVELFDAALPQSHSLIKL